MAKAKYEKRIRNKRTHKWMTITASTENELERKIDEQYDKWENEAYVEERRQEAEDLNDDLMEINKHLEALSYIGLKHLTLDAYEQKRLSRIHKKKRKEPTLEKAEKDVGVTKISRLIGKVPGIQKRKYDDQRREAEVLWNKRKAEYEEQVKKDEKRYQERLREMEAQIASDLRTLKSGDKEAVCDHFRYILDNDDYSIDLQEPFLPISLRLQFNPETGTLEFSYRIPNGEEITTIKEYNYNEKTDTIEAHKYDKKTAANWRLRIAESVLLRAAALVFYSDIYHHIKSVSITGFLHYFDPAFGMYQDKNVIRVALTRDTFNQLRLKHVNPAELFGRVLKAKISKELYTKEPFLLEEIK